MKPSVAIPCALMLIGRAISRRSLTPAGIAWAIITVSIHALHPSPIPFSLLGVFFLLGTSATKVKHEVKATLTLSASGDGSGGGEGGSPRGAIQVLANSGVASLLCCVHVAKFGYDLGSGTYGPSQQVFCFGGGKGGDGTAAESAVDLVMMGIIANYAVVTADTLSSELGILATELPRLITTGATVPRGTNGGVTATGLLAGTGGAAFIGVLTVSLLTFCDNPLSIWDFKAKTTMWAMITVWGTVGSLLDSWLGAMLQASVIDRRTGKVVEGVNGKRVMVFDDKTREQGKGKSGGSRVIGNGRDILDNNQINVLMAAIMSLGAMGVGGMVTGAQLSYLWR